MITYKLNDSQDIFLQNGTIATITEISEVAQDVKTKLKLIFGEVFYNTQIGVPYFTVIFVKPFKKDIADSIIIENIYSSPGVSQIENYVSIVDTVQRKLSIKFEASTVFSESQLISETFTI
jgi:hypothetical protein